MKAESEWGLTWGNHGRAISRSTMINDVDHLGKKFTFDFEGNAK